MNQTKIYDIAGAAGVSLATVSRVLNHPEKVKEATRSKVMKIVKEKGYKPNANARGLASRKSTTVAVVVPELTRASVAEMIQGIDDSAKKYGYSIRLFINSNPENAVDFWGEIIASSVDGILFMNDDIQSAAIEQVEYSPVPIVFVNALSPNDSYTSVSIDNETWAYNITKEMIKKGRKDILFISTEHKYTLNDLKEKGYLKAMKEANLKERIVKTSGDISLNEKYFEELIKKAKPEVALAVRDSMAISFLNTCQKHGYNVPEDIEVIGFQDTRYAILSNPKLTCVELPVYEIGNKAMEKLTCLMADNEDDNKAPEKIVVETKIIWRDSTK